MNLNPQNNNSPKEEFTVNQRDMDVQKKIYFYEDLANFRAGEESLKNVIANAYK